MTGYQEALHTQAEPLLAQQPAPAHLASSLGPWPDSGEFGGGRSRGQAEAVAASLGAQPRDGPGIPRLCLYMAEERWRHSARLEVLF